MKRGTATRGIAAALAIAGIAGAFGVPAQQGETVARLKSVKGNVLVSQESGLATGSASQRVANGTRIITTANAEAVIAYDNGCEVRMKENERLEIDSDKRCEAMIAETFGSPPSAAVGVPLLALIVPLGGATAVVGAGGGLPPVSPN